MIYTLTVNPAIDLNVRAADMAPNRVTRTTGALHTPNGKGLNVSFTLQRYGVPSTILGFFGGYSGDYIVEGSRAMGCEVMGVRVDGITRINYFVSLEDGSGDEYKFVEAGAEVSRERQLEMLDLIDGLDDLSCLVISGSLAPGIDVSYYDELVDHVVAKGAEFAFDISHPCLARLVERGPLLIKPNDEELEQIFGVDAHDEAAILASLAEVRGRGAKNILLTLGGDGAYFASEQGIWHASAAPIKMLSSACAGDATLGSFLSLWFDDRDGVERALVRAMATGGNVAECFGLGDFARVGELEPLIEVRRIA